MNKPQHFNISELEVLSKGDTLFVLKMMEAFCASAPAQLERMREAAGAAAFEDLAALAHRLQPSFHYLGRPDLSALLAEMEDEEKKRTKEEILAATQDFLAQVQAVVEEVKAFTETLKNV